MKYIPGRNENYGLTLLDDGFFDDLFDSNFFANKSALSMKTDIKEEDGNYVLDIDMPGFNKEDIKITLEDGYLSVEAKSEVNDEEKDAKGHYIRRERIVGSCARNYYVGDIDESLIKAEYDKGVLTITLPKETKQLETKKSIAIL